MAGPGGGPPRRSHTKSRKGCDQCKKRHIRCDETFPQCLNCTKHKSRCPYNGTNENGSADSDKPDLMWTPEAVAAIAEWRKTGNFPFPAMAIDPPLQVEKYAVEELRLIHHLAAIYNNLERCSAVEFTIWVREIPKIIRLSVTSEYVMAALLAFSAAHIAHLTACSRVGSMALAYRGKAMSELGKAIPVFCRENSDAILAASMVLSWQETNWRDWTHLMMGTSTVISAMKDWQHESQFLDYISESSTIPARSPSSPPSPKHRHPHSHPADGENFARAQARIQKLEAYLKAKRQDTKLVAQLLTFVKAARRVPPPTPVEEQFERLRDLRMWLFWLPVRCLEETRGSANSLVVIAHYYTVALLVERVFSGVGAAYFGSLSMGPIEQICRRICCLEVEFPEEFKDHQEFVAFPLDTLAEFRAKFHNDEMELTSRASLLLSSSHGRSLSWSEPGACSQGATSPALEPTITPAQAQSIYAAGNPFSYSAESLALGAESAPASAISPLSLSPSCLSRQHQAQHQSQHQPQHQHQSQHQAQHQHPHPQQHPHQYQQHPHQYQQHQGYQYLGIPSPSYAPAAYSPSSSSHDSAFSDIEEQYSPCYLSGGFAAPRDGSPTDLDQVATANDMPGTHGDQTGSRNSFGRPTTVSTTAGSASTTPQYPLPADLALYLPRTPSPFLGANQFVVLPMPESPVPGHRRHCSSTSSIPFYMLSLEEMAKAEQQY